MTQLRKTGAYFNVLRGQTVMNLFSTFLLSHDFLPVLHQHVPCLLLDPKIQTRCLSHLYSPLGDQHSADCHSVRNPPSISERCPALPAPGSCVPISHLAQQPASLPPFLQPLSTGTHRKTDPSLFSKGQSVVLPRLPSPRVQPRLPRYASLCDVPVPQLTSQ